MKTILHNEVCTIHTMIYVHMHDQFPNQFPKYIVNLSINDIVVIIIDDALRSYVSLDRLKSQLYKLNNYDQTKHIKWYLDTMLPPTIMADYIETIKEYAHINHEAFKQKFLALCSPAYKAQLLLDGGYE